MKLSWSEFKLFSRSRRLKSWIIKTFSRLSRWRRSLFNQKVFQFFFSNFLLFLRNNRLYSSTKRSCCSSFKRFIFIFFLSFWRARLIKFQIASLIHKSHDFLSLMQFAHFDRSTATIQLWSDLRQRSHGNMTRTFLLTILLASNWRELNLQFITTWLAIK